MAKFGTDVTSMSGVNGSGIFGMNVQEGVVDKSAAMNVVADTAMMEAVGKTAIDAHRGYELARYESEQEAVISDYMNRRESNVGQMQMELAAQDNALNAVWDSPTSSDAERLAVESAFSEKLTKLRNAQKQGVMSTDEFNARILQTTREAVARNPGLYDDLIAHSKKVLGLSGITATVEADKAAADASLKQRQKAEEYILSIAKENNVPVRFDANGRANIDEIAPVIQQIQMEKQVVEAADRLTSFDEAQFRQYGTTYMVGKYNAVNEQAIQIMADKSQPFASRITTVKMLFNSLRQSVVGDPRINKIIDKAPVQSSLSQLDKMVESAITSLDKFGSDDEAARFLQNTTQMARNNNYLELNKMLNPEVSTMLTNLMSTPFAARLVSENTELANQTMTTFANMMSGVGNGLGTRYTVSGADGKPIITQGLGSLLRDAGAGYLVSKDALNNAFSVMSKALSDPATFEKEARAKGTDPAQEKWKLYQHYIKELGNPQNKDGFKSLDEPQVVGLSNNIDEYLTMSLTGLTHEMKRATDQGATVEWDILPDGRVAINSNNPAVVEDLNRRLVIRINDSIKAYANLMGTDNKSAALAVLPKYANYFSAPAMEELNSMAVNIKTPQDARNAFAKGTITRKERDAILRDIKK